MHGQVAWESGAYSMSLLGYELTDTVDVVAYQRGDDNTAVAAGAVRGVDISGEEPITGVDLAIDHAFDQTVAVSVSGDEPYGGAYKAQMIYTLSDRIHFFTEDEDLPIQVATPVMDEPMQALERYVWVPLGLGDGYDFGPLETARMYQRLTAEQTSIDITALAPFQLEQPAFGLAEDPTVVAEGSLEEITWTADTTANQVELMVQATGDPGAYEEFCWEIFAPAALGRAAVPVLPSEVFDGTFLAARKYALYMTQSELIGIDDANDLWSTPGGRYPREYRVTRRLSFFDVE